jgi:hypothetical protein
VLQEGLFALLAADAGVSGFVGSRIYAGAAPDDLKAYPCVEYSLVGGSASSTFKTTGVLQQRVEINGFSFTSYAEAAKIRQAAIKALIGWSQALGDGTTILDAELLNPGTDFVSEQRCFRCMAEFYVLYTLSN